MADAIVRVIENRAIVTVLGADLIQPFVAAAAESAALAILGRDIFCDGTISGLGPFLLFTPRAGFGVQGSGDTQFITGAMPAPPGAGTLYLIVVGINDGDPRLVRQNGANLAPTDIPEGIYPRFKWLTSGPDAGSFDLVWPDLTPAPEPAAPTDPYAAWAGAQAAALIYQGSVS